MKQVSAIVVATRVTIAVGVQRFLARLVLLVERIELNEIDIFLLGLLQSNLLALGHLNVIKVLRLFFVVILHDLQLNQSLFHGLLTFHNRRPLHVLHIEANTLLR